MWFLLILSAGLLGFIFYDGLAFMVNEKMCVGVLKNNMMARIDPEIYEAYDQGNDSVAGNIFRSTFMVTAISYAFNKDLRPDFIDLNFPIDNAIYDWLWSRAECPANPIHRRRDRGMRSPAYSPKRSSPIPVLHRSRARADPSRLPPIRKSGRSLPE